MIVNLFTPMTIEANRQKQIIGILKNYDKEKITLQLTQPIETTIEIPRKNITNLKLKYNWEDS